MKRFVINNREISEQSRPYVIAEVGVNYYDIAIKENIGLLDAAKLMIKSAAKEGADAVKFQTYKAEKLASKKSPAYWDKNEEPTSSQYELFSKFDKLGLEEYKELASFCESQKITFISTPFDFESSDYLNELMPIYKISSSDLTNLPFIEHASKKGKPIILSTGAATIGEIEEAINTVLKTGNKQICLMHCILDYPTDYNDANLNMIKHLEQVFPNCLIGYSDHTKPDESMLTLTTAYIYGAKIIEKHFTLDKELKGNDHYHSMDLKDLRRFVKNIDLLQKIGGQYYKCPLDCELNARKQARRSIVTRVSLKKGEIITKEKITFKRPGVGISPVDLDKVLGRRVKEKIDKDEIIYWSQI